MNGWRLGNVRHILDMADTKLTIYTTTRKRSYSLVDVLSVPEPTPVSRSQGNCLEVVQTVVRYPFTLYCLVSISDHIQCSD